MRKTFSAWRATSSSPMKTSHVEAEQRARGGGRDAVLARAGLGDHASLAHVLREQHLAEHVVDLVRARVREVLALQVDRARRASSLMRRAW